MLIDTHGRRSKESDNEENADFVIYNTCTVRENANLRVYGRLGQLKKAKRNKPIVIRIIVINHRIWRKRVDE